MYLKYPVDSLTHYIFLSSSFTDPPTLALMLPSPSLQLYFRKLLHLSGLLKMSPNFRIPILTLLLLKMQIIYKSITQFESKLLPLSKKYIGQVRWLMPVIPAIWEDEAGRLGSQEIKTILANMVKPHLC